jgi:hypothetical protein
MGLSSWILPTLIGTIAAVLLISILYNPQIRATFSDLGALIQLQTSRPVYYGIDIAPLNSPYTQQHIPTTQGPITTFGSPLYTGQIMYPIYNYYPQTPLLNPNTNGDIIPKNTNSPINSAYNMQITPPDAHKAYYWELSGGIPFAYYPDTNMDNVKPIEDK